MPRFFFHLITPDRIERDEIGLHLPTSVAACREARHAIPLVSAELIENGCDPMRCRFRIEDAAGREIAVVPFADLVHRAPARGPRFRSAPALQRLAHAAYRGVFEGSPNAYLVLTPDFSIVGANDAYLDAIGRPRDALVGHNAFDAFPENPNDEVAKSGSQLRASFKGAALAHARHAAASALRPHGRERQLERAILAHGQLADPRRAGGGHRARAPHGRRDAERACPAPPETPAHRWRALSPLSAL
jgi:PAS domain S-box-containing protein